MPTAPLLGARTDTCFCPDPCAVHPHRKVPRRANVTHSASPSPRVRLLSTPRQEHDMSTTIAGVRFSDRTAALLDHAIANGFTIEPGKRPEEVVVKSPDGTSRPITFSEKNAKFNQAHYANMRRHVYASGCPPLPAEGAVSPAVIATLSAADVTDVAPFPLPRKTKAKTDDEGVRLMSAGGKVLPPLDVVASEAGASTAAGIFKSLAMQLGIEEGLAFLLGGLAGGVVAYSQDARDEAASAMDVDAAIAAAVAVVKTEAARELEAALQMTQTAEERCRDAERRCTVAEERGARTGVLLTQIQEKLRIAEDKARRFDQLQALMAPAVSA